MITRNRTLESRDAESREWWTVSQLAKLYGVSLRSVYQAIDKGRLIAHRFGAGRGGIRVADNDRIEWENKCRQARTAEAPRRNLGVGRPAARLIEKHLEL